MKSMLKILTRYVLSAAGVTLTILLLNFAVLVAWGFQSGKAVQKDYSISQFADGLSELNGAFSLSQSMQDEIQQHHAWAMLLSNDGKVIWSENLPSDVPLSYSVSDVASFTRWYLRDYPVHVWRHSNGLFVLADKKGSVWKHAVQVPQSMMENSPLWALSALILNAAAAILLSLLFGVRFFRSLKPVAEGIEALCQNQAVDLPTRGLLGHLAAGINQTSSQLQRQDAALKKRDRARTSWIAGVSHDIRTPLSLVMGYASQLEQDPELPARGRKQAGMIRSQSERIRTLIEDLNLASKLEYDMQPLRQAVVPLAVLLRSVTVDYLNQGLSNTYSITLFIPEPAQNTKVSGDAQLLMRAVSNLISNSIRHNPKGCAITVTLEASSSYCSLRVSDSGVGFSAELLRNLNTPGNAKELEHHGLGLTIVQQIVTAHGGTTRIWNLPEGGCSIELCLPLNT
jgi:signal transduction histidine kinase